MYTIKEIVDIHQIKGWRLVKDNEDKMELALENQLLIANIPYTLDVTNIKQQCLLNPVEAYKGVDDTECVDQGHSILIVGDGIFYASEPFKGLSQIKYWIIKNQWGTKWGDGGYGYVIENSSLFSMKMYEYGRALSEEEMVTEKWLYSPIIPYVEIQSPPMDVPVKTLREMKKFIKDQPSCGLLFMLYHKEFPNPSTQKAFTQIARLFEYDKDTIVALHIITNDTRKEFCLKKRDTTAVILAYKANYNGEVRQETRQMVLNLKEKRLPFLNC